MRHESRLLAMNKPSSIEPATLWLRTLVGKRKKSSNAHRILKKCWPRFTHIELDLRHFDWNLSGSWRVNSPRFTHIAARTHVPIYVSHATSNHETSTLYLGIVEMQQGRELRRASTQINFPPRFTWINQFSFQLQLQLIKRKPELDFCSFYHHYGQWRTTRRDDGDSVVCWGC